MLKQRSSPTKKILAVDDDPIQCRLFLGVLAGQGEYEVVIAKNGESALEKAALFLPDVVLLDIHLPDISGLDVLRELKRSRPQLPIIMVSADIESQLLEKSIIGGASEFLEKPFMDFALITAIKRAFERVLSIKACMEPKTEGPMPGEPHAAQ